MSKLLQRASLYPVRTVLLLSFLLLLSGNWLLPLMDRDEPRFAEAAREMAQRHDLVIPWFNGGYRFDKPPLIYWFQILSYLCFGENAFAARLPSVIFSTATAMTLLFWGRRSGNERAGFCAAIILLTSVQFLVHGRLSVADMPMVFFVTVATWSGWELTRTVDKALTIWWWGLYLSLGLGFLAKGPVAWLPLIGIFLGRYLRPADFTQLRGILLGLLVSLAVVALWGIPALVATHGQFFKVGIGHHVLYRSFGIMEGHGGPGLLGFILTLPLYFVTFFFSFFPWAFSVPLAIKSWWARRSHDPLGWYLLVQAAIIFAVFSLVRTKLPHYTLPAFPAISFWLARRVSSDSAVFEWIARRAIPMCGVALVVTLILFRLAEPYFVAARLWNQAGPVCAPQMEFAAVRFNEPSLVWEFRRGLTNYLQQIEPGEANRFLQKPGGRILIVPTAQALELSNVGSNVLRFQARGLDTARFRRIDLTAFVKQPE